MTKSVTILLGRFLIALANLAAIDQHIVFVGDAVDADRAEGQKPQAAHHTSRRSYAPLCK
jgi:hypothetical protein